MKTSENINEIAKALSSAQGEMKPAQKNASNPFLKSKYADLASVIDCSREVLTAHGIAVSQGVENEEGKVAVTTRLMHTSGQWIESSVSAQPKGQDPQAVGSVITYLRRYGYTGLVGIATEDDDGHAGTSGNAQQRQSNKSRNSQPSQANSSSTTPPPETPISENTRKRIHALGTKVYGDDWDDRRHELIKVITKGRTQSSNEITADEASTLIKGMEKKEREIEAAAVTHPPDMTEWTSNGPMPEGSGQAV